MKEIVEQLGTSKMISGMDLLTVAPWFVKDVESGLLRSGETEVSNQVHKLWIKSNILGGTADRMSFGIFPLPFPSFNDLGKIWPLKDERKVTVNVHGGLVTFSIDCFGFIERAEISNVPMLYDALSNHFSFSAGEVPPSPFSEP